MNALTEWTFGDFWMTCLTDWTFGVICTFGVWERIYKSNKNDELKDLKDAVSKNLNW